MPLRGRQPGPRARAPARRGGRERRSRLARRLVRPLGGAAHRRVDRQAGQGASCPRPTTRDAELHEDVALPSPYELGQEFFRWEFAVAVAGSILGINPFDQPDVQAAKDKTNEVLARRRRRARAGGLARRAARAGARGRLRLHPGVRRPGARRRARSRSSTGRARAGTSSRTASARATSTRPGSSTRAARTPASSSRSSTTTATSCRSRARGSASRRLIRAQAAGDYESLKERGRRVARGVRI